MSLRDIIPQDPLWLQWFEVLCSSGGHYFTTANGLKGFFFTWGPLHQLFEGAFSPGDHNSTGTSDFGGPLSLSALYNTNDLRFYAFLGVTMSPIPMVWRTFFLFTRGTLHQIFKGPFSPGYNYSTYTNNLGDHYPLWTTITPIIWEPLSPRTH